MEKASVTGIRVDAKAYERAKNAGLCISRIATKALNNAAEALEKCDLIKSDIDGGASYAEENTHDKQ